MSTPFEVCPYDAPLGAEIRGLDLSVALPQATIDALRDTWHDYLVLVFRDQTMNDEQQFAFTNQFGALEHTPQKLLELAREGARRRICAADYRDLQRHRKRRGTRSPR